MINPREFSEIILSYGSFSHKKLQKLCYYVYCEYLLEYGEKIANVEFEAWVHGPVSPEIYQIYKNYGWNRIPEYNGNIAVSNIIYNRITNIIKKYINFTANQLEEMTHMESPWKNARRGYRKYECSNEVILESEILNYYQNR